MSFQTERSIIIYVYVCILYIYIYIYIYGFKFKTNIGKHYQNNVMNTRRDEIELPRKL